MTVPLPVLRCFEHARWAAKQNCPYVFGGGHPGFKASGGGYDCSGWVSAILHAGGVLWSSVALDTHGLEHWGHGEQGEFMTVWVRNSNGVEHTFIEFKIPDMRSLRWSVAPHTGQICGWKSGVDLTGYRPRRRP